MFRHVVGSSPRHPRARRNENTSVSRYLGEIGKTPLLTPEREVAICRRIEAGQIRVQQRSRRSPRSGSDSVSERCRPMT